MGEQFENMTVIELRNYAREHHIPLPAGVNKQGIIERLKAASEENGEPENESGSVSSAQPDPQPAAPARQRTASIIADDGEYDYEDGDLAYRQPPRAPQQTVYTQRPAAPAKPAESARPAAGAKQDVLSTISSKAPAFNIEGVRAWHNPKSFQQSPSYNSGGYQQPAARQGWNKTGPAPSAGPHTDQRMTQARPGFQPAGAAAEMQARTPEDGHAAYGADSRYLKDYHAVQKITMPELLAEGEFMDQQGILSLEEDGSGRMYDERYPRRSRPVYISHTQIRRYSLREGDWIAGKTKAIRGADGRRLMVYIERVNGEAADDLKDRADFLNLDVITPKTPVLTEGGKKSPLRFGHRALLTLRAEDDGRAVLCRLAGAVQQAHEEDVRCVVLSLGKTPEEGQALTDQCPCPCLPVDIALDGEQQLREARGVLERAKRLAESGRKAVVLLDSLPALIGLADETGSSLFVSSFFGTGRALKNGGSVTVIALVRAEDAECPGLKKLQSFVSLNVPADQLVPED